MNEFEKLIVRCKKDDDFVFSRNVEYSCGQEFNIARDNVFSIAFPGYDGEEERQYYAICPNCGHINILDKNMISEEIKQSADIQNITEPYQYQKNNLMSELIYFEKVGVKRLTRNFK